VKTINKKSLYYILFEEIKEKIESGKILYGERLTPVRVKASEKAVNPATVVKAYKMLEEINYVSTLKGSGTFVSYKKENIAKNIKKDQYNFQMNYEAVFDFASSTPDVDFYPVEDFKKCVDTAFEKDKYEIFQYEDIKGYSGLIEEIKKNHKSADTGNNSVQIVNGAQQALDIIVRLFSGCSVLIEKPRYSGIINLAGNNVFFLENTFNNIKDEDIEKIIKNNNIKIIYCNSVMHNPTNENINSEKRDFLIELSEKYDFYIIEDDCFSDFYDKDLINMFKPADKFGRVFYVKTYSKTFMPGLRMGYMMFPEKFSGKIEKLKYASDISNSGLIQRSFFYFLKDGYYRKYIEKYRKEISEKRQLFSAFLKKNSDFFYFDKNYDGNGIYFWVKIKNIYLYDNFTDLCRDNGIIFMEGRNFNGDKGYIRISVNNISVKKLKASFEVFESIIKKAGNNPAEKKYFPKV